LPTSDVRFGMKELRFRWDSIWHGRVISQMDRENDASHETMVFSIHAKRVSHIEALVVALEFGRFRIDDPIGSDERPAKLVKVAELKIVYVKTTRKGLRES